MSTHPPPPHRTFAPDSKDKVKKYQTLAALYTGMSRQAGKATSDDFMNGKLEEEVIDNETHYTLMADLARMAVEDFKQERATRVNTLQSSWKLDCIATTGCKASSETINK
jgi:hypothetical protein